MFRVNSGEYYRNVTNGYCSDWSWILEYSKFLLYFDIEPFANEHVLVLKPEKKSFLCFLALDGTTEWNIHWWITPVICVGKTATGKLKSPGTEPRELNG